MSRLRSPLSTRFRPSASKRRSERRAAGASVRIAQVTPRYFPFTGGIETHVKELSNRLGDRGLVIDAISADPTHQLPGHEAAGPVTISRYRAWPRRRDWYIAPGVFFAVLRGDWDLVHCQGVHTFVAPFAMAASRLRRLPYIVTFHTGGHSSPSRNRLRSLQWRLLAPLLRRASALVAVCEWEVELFSAALGLPASRFHVIRNGAELPTLSAETAAEAVVRRGDDELLIASVGRLEHYKGHERVIDALAQIVTRRPARLWIVGSGPDEARLQALVAEKGLTDHVTFAYFSPERRGALAQLLHDVDVMTLLSDYEAHPVAVMEALALGCPVVVAATSGLVELARMGWVEAVPTDASAQSVADTIELVATTTPPDIAFPTWDGCAEEVLHVYETTLGVRCGS